MSRDANGPFQLSGSIATASLKQRLIGAESQQIKMRQSCIDPKTSDCRPFEEACRP